MIKAGGLSKEGTSSCTWRRKAQKAARRERAAFQVNGAAVAKAVPQEVTSVFTDWRDQRGWRVRMGTAERP